MIGFPYSISSAGAHAPAKRGQGEELPLQGVGRSPTVLEGVGDGVPKVLQGVGQSPTVLGGIGGKAPKVLARKESLWRRFSFIRNILSCSRR